MLHRPEFSRGWRSYATATLLVGITLGARLACDPLFGPHQAFQFFYIPVVIMVWVAGFRPAIYTLLLGLVAGAWFFSEPRGSFLIGSPEHRVAAIIYIVVGLALTILGELLRDKQLRLTNLVREHTRQAQFLATTLGSIGDAVVVTDRTGRITLLNAEAEKLTGWKANVAHGLPLRDVYRALDPQTRALLPCPSTKLDRGGSPEFSETVILSPRSGIDVWIDSTVALITEGETAAGLVLVFRNVSERKRVRDSLAESRRQLDLALVAGKMGAWQWNIATGEVHWSEGLERIHGLVPGTFGGRFVDLKRDIHPDDIEAVLGSLRRAIDSRGHYYAEYRIRHPSGDDRWVECVGNVSVGPDGEAQELSGICIDISERKKADAALRESEAHLKAILEQVPIAVGLMNPEGRILYANSAMRRFIPEVIPTRDPSRLSRWRAARSDGSAVPTSLWPSARALRGETATEGMEFVYTADDGAEIPIRVVATPFWKLDRTLAGAVMIVLDLTEQKRNAVALQNRPLKMNRAEQSADYPGATPAGAVGPLTGG